MSILMGSCFLISWTPYAVVGMASSYGPPGIVPDTSSIYSALLAKSSQCWNPIIYIGMNKQVS